MVRSSKRKSKNRKLIINVLIFCCETEKKYLKAYFFKYPLPIHIKIDYNLTKETTPNEDSYDKHIKQLNAKSYEVSYKKVYHIFDLETPNLNNQVQGMLNYVSRCNGHKKINPILQMPSIEVWFLQHFEDNVGEYQNAKEVERKLKKYFVGYNKNNTVSWCNIINNTKNAIEIYINQKQNYNKLTGRFAHHSITNPMMEIADLLQDLYNLK